MTVMKEEGLPPTEGYQSGGMGQKGPVDLLAYAASITGSKGHQMGKPLSLTHKDPKAMASNMPNVTIDSAGDADGDGDRMATGPQEGFNVKY